MSESHPTRLLAVLLAVALVGGVFAGTGALGQQASDGDPQQTSYVRVIHASPDAQAVDVYVDNQSVLQGVEFGQVGQYLAVEAGSHNLTITAAGDPEAVVYNETVAIGARTVTTVAATGEVTENRTSFQVVRYLDDAYRPSENESAISVFHLSPDAPTVDVTAGNGSVVIANNVSFREASDYVTVPAGNYTVEIRAATATDDGPVVTTVDVSLEGGTAYSALALGYLDPANAPADEPFRVVPTEDATMTVHLPGEPVQQRDQQMNQTGAGG